MAMEEEIKREPRRCFFFSFKRQVVTIDQICTMKEEKMSRIASRFLALETTDKKKNMEEGYHHKRRESFIAQGLARCLENRVCPIFINRVKIRFLLLFYFVSF